MMIPELQRVVCAANRHKRTDKIVCGARHFDMIMRAQMISSGWADSEQGFIDQWGNFLTRQEAYVVAKRQGQLRDNPSHIEGTLYSEDLY